MAARSVASAGPSKIEVSTGVLPSTGTKCAKHTWGSDNQPGNDGRRLPWNSNNNTSASTCTGAAA